jgi:hypothetical protein
MKKKKEQRLAAAQQDGDADDQDFDDPVLNL